MKLARALIVVCGALALSACGTATSEPSADKPEAASPPPPAIEAIDEPDAPGNVSDPDVAVITTNWSLCFDDEQTTSEGDCDSSKTTEKLRRHEEEFARAVTVAKGSEPRAIARLRLSDRGPSSQALLIAWRGQAGGLCLASEVESADTGMGSGPHGPCVPEPHCAKICLDLSQDGTGRSKRHVLSGVVAADGDTLRMTLDDGRVVTYELSGPLVPGFREYRVFMLDLGPDLSTRLELLKGTNVIAEEKEPEYVIRGMRCSEKYPVDMPRTPDEAQKSQLAQCFENGK